MQTINIIKWRLNADPAIFNLGKNVAISYLAVAAGLDRNFHKSPNVTNYNNVIMLPC